MLAGQAGHGNSMYYQALSGTLVLLSWHVVLVPVAFVKSWQCRAVNVL
jgi:hypothetical protein